MDARRRLATPLVALLPALAAAPAAPAQPLAGKVCQGTFNSGKEREGSEGGLELRFGVGNGRLTAQFARLVGKAAFDAAAYNLTLGRNRPPIDTAGYEQLGNVQNLTSEADKIRFVDPLGARVELAYRNGDLSGQSDPRGGRDPRMTRLQFVNLRCR
jgi:hypothetical protein